MSKNKRIVSDLLREGVTYLSSFISVGVLLAIVVFVFSKGIRFLNPDLILEDYESKGYVADFPIGWKECDCAPSIDLADDVEYSSRFGIGLKDTVDLLGRNVVMVVYVHPDSPYRNLHDKGVGTDVLVLREDYHIVRIAFEADSTALSRHGAQAMVEAIDRNPSIREIEYQTQGGGIGGSLLTTLVLIGLTIVLALPLGVGAAIYLNEYAPPGRFTRLLRSLIETLTGVPSIIYGLLGLAVFVPLTVQLTSATGGNLLSGAMTLSVILLPIIIRTTEESLKVVPDDWRNASLALGASRTQTTFQVVLPSALPGILTATLLSIGRIVGESAALVFAIGTAIKDQVSITDKSTTLAVHIWSMMTDEPANIELSATIAIIILILVVTLNTLVKWISNRYLKRKLGSAYER
jgi:phosphate transport system permease protein